MIGNIYRGVGVDLKIHSTWYHWTIPNVQSVRFTNNNGFFWNGGVDENEGHINIDRDKCSVYFHSDGGFYSITVQGK